MTSPPHTGPFSFTLSVQSPSGTFSTDIFNIDYDLFLQNNKTCIGIQEVKNVTRHEFINLNPDSGLYKWLLHEAQADQWRRLQEKQQ